MASLKAKVTRKKDDVITLEIRKEDLEAFCAAAGLYHKNFLDLLDSSLRNHKAGRVTERRSLYELMDE